MTTVVDPLGTPIPSYNKSGITVVHISGSSSDSPTPVVSVSGTTIVMVSSTNGPNVLLPESSDIGDVLELYSADGAQVSAFAPSGVTVNGSQSAASAFSSRGVVFRKTSATNWQVLGGV
jgi:hypothetical protein